MNYKESGVDIEKGDLFIEKIKPFIKQTYNQNVTSGVGGFAALYDQGESYLATGTDGVGTKIKLAIELGIHHTIGQDLVAMCVNDILCTGATPSFFLDYLATDSLDLNVHTDVVKGIADGCRIAKCALIGGETAEMPGMYHNNDYDLAGFVVGHLDKNKYIDGKNIKEGMAIYALPSSGFHSNGFSLIRNLIANESDQLKKECLTPTRIYTQEVQEICKKFDIKGMAHITGGGLNNIKRMSDSVGYVINNLPTMPNFMDSVLSKSKLSLSELYKTFNMGIGFVFVCNENDDLLKLFPDIIQIGYTSNKITGVECLGTMI